MKVRQGCPVLGAVVVVLVLLLGSARSSADSFDIYRGGIAVGQSIKEFGGWGSGLTGYGQDSQFLRIVTQGFYQGGRLELDNVDLTPFLQGSLKNSYLELELQIEPREEDLVVKTEGGVGEEYPPEGGEGAMGRPEGGGEEPPENGGYPPEYGPEGPEGGLPVEEIPRVTKLRAVMLTDKGLFGTEGHSAFGAPLEQEGWTRVDIPLDSFAVDGKPPAGVVKRLLLFGNGEDALLVKAIRLFKEDPADVVVPKCPPDASTEEGKPMELAARYTGTQRARFYWDFDLSDGLQRDATGEAVRAIFDAPGTYVVTLIAEPVGGRAAPRMATMTVTVTPIPYARGEGGEGGYTRE